MRIVNLIENTEGSGGCLYEHGLSFYIETANHRLLVDTGASNAFAENADKLGVDLKQVDLLILSHGHYDHSGGILKFAKINSNARILMQTSAGDAYYHKNATLEKYIGIDPEILALSQVEFIEGNRRIDEELFLFSGVRGRRLWPSGNKELMVRRNGIFEQDEFLHEQYLVIEEGKRRVLISGCAHNGILNILEAYEKLYGGEPDAVISGFHMQKKCGYSKEDLEMIKKIADELKGRETKFYTGHCTGEIPYQILKECLGDQLVYVHSGDEILL